VSGLHVHQGDFLHCNGDLGKFDRVVMNPPFADQADIDHVTHALSFLKPGGKLVAIMSAGASFRQDRKASKFQELIEGLGGTMNELPEDSFKQSGTNVRTVLVEVRAP
jgi:16S rRNA G1207 methylase RsmC